MRVSRSTAVGGSSTAGVKTLCSSPSPAVARYSWLLVRPQVIATYSSWRSSAPVATVWQVSAVLPCAPCTVLA